MYENRLNVKQCKVCGAVVTSIRTAISTVLVDAKPITIYETKGGQVIGYTLAGRRVQGDEIKPGEPHPGAYTAHRIHLCSRSRAEREAKALEQLKTGT